MMDKKSFKKGLTLIELLVAISVMGILAVGLMVGLNPVDQIKKTNDTKRKSDLSQMQKAFELYYQDNGQYPPLLPACGSQFGSGTAVYIKNIPCDPKAGHSYIYFSPPGGQSYYLYANLERGGKDPQACPSGAACPAFSSGISGFPAANACGASCNFGVASPNTTP